MPSSEKRGSIDSFDNPIFTTDLEIHNTFQDILKELKKINFHLSLITDNSIENRDVE